MAEPVPEVLMVGMGDLVMAVELEVVVEATVEKWVVQVLVVWVAAEVAEVVEAELAAALVLALSVWERHVPAPGAATGPRRARSPPGRGASVPRRGIASPVRVSG